VGTPKFLIMFAVPSVASVIEDKKHGADYYSQPWEYTADFFGGADRGEYYYNYGSGEDAFDYLFKVRKSRFLPYVKPVLM